MTEKHFEFHELVAKVEERFRPAYDIEKVGNAKTESQMEVEMVSTGWWVVLARFGVAVRFGNMKPDIEAGDTLVLTAKRIPKKPEATAPANPPAPAPSSTPRAETVTS